MITQKWDGKSPQEWVLNIGGREVELAIITAASYIDQGMAGDLNEVSPCVIDRRITLPLEWFQTYSRVAMRFIFWHEVGHMINNHRQYPPRERRPLWKEFEADSFAVARMGYLAGVEAMSMSFHDCMAQGDFIAAHEFKVRLELIRTYCVK